MIKTLPELQEVILFLDGDEAGRAATEQLAEKLRTLRRELRISAVVTPQGEDVNSLLTGHEPSIFNHLIQERVMLTNADSPTNPTDDSPPVSTHEGPAPNAPVAPTSQRSATRLDSSNPEKLLYQSDSLQFTVWGGVDLAHLHRLKVNLHVQLVENRSS